MVRAAWSSVSSGATVATSSSARLPASSSTATRCHASDRGRTRRPRGGRRPRREGPRRSPPGSGCRDRPWPPRPVEIVRGRARDDAFVHDFADGDLVEKRDGQHGTTVARAAPRTSGSSPRRMRGFHGSCSQRAARRGYGPSAMRVLTVNAGSSSLKLRLLGDDDALLARRSSPRPPGGPTRAAPRGARRLAWRGRDRPPRGPRRHEVHRTGAPRPRGHRGAAGAHPARAAAPACRPRRDGRRGRGASGRTGRRVPRHGISQPHPGRRRDLRPAARVARATFAPPLRLPRPLARLRLAPGGRAARPAPRAATGGQLPPRRRRVARGRGGRSLRRHDDGLHAGGGPRHGDTLRKRRSRSAALAPPARRARDRGGVGRAGASLGTARARRHRRHAGGPRRRPRGRRAGRPREGRLLHRLRGLIAAMAASLGGLDALVFTGGVGERSSEIRTRRRTGSDSSASPSTLRATPRRDRRRRLGAARHGQHPRDRRPGRTSRWPARRARSSRHSDSVDHVSSRPTMAETTSRGVVVRWSNVAVRRPM